MKENCNNPSKNSRYHFPASFEFRNVDVFDGDTRIVRVARHRYSSCNVSQSGGSVAKCSVFAWGNGTSFQKNWDISFDDSRRGEKEIYFFFLNAFAKATEIDRVGVPLEYRNCRKRIIRAARWMKKLSSFYLSFEVPVQMARRERNGGGWKCSMKFIFAVRRKWKKSFDPRCVKFSYADGIFQHYWFNIGTLWMNVAVRVVHLYVKLVAVFPFFGEIWKLKSSFHLRRMVQYSGKKKEEDIDHWILIVEYSEKY